MTFKEWFNSASHRAKYSTDHPAYLAAQEAWYAAHEACAKVCEDMCTVNGYERDLALVSVAAAIRARKENT